MRALVTGGSGFIGSHVVDKLRDAGVEPVIYDRLPSPWHEGVDTRLGDLHDLETLASAMEDCDAVLHLAAAADVNEVAKDPVGSESVNARGTLNVLEAARRADVKRVVYASTIWVYTGESGQRVDEESDLGMPNHLYTATKLAGEMYCRSYSELYDIEYTILRFGIPYGPRARPAAVVPAFVNKALNGEALTVAGGGAQSRRFVYVEDLAEGCVAGLRDVAANRVYNLVSDESVTILQIAELVQEVVAPVEIEHTGGRKADYVGVEVCGKRAAAELDWTAKTPFREGVTRYVAWRREQEVAPAAVLAPTPATPPVVAAKAEAEAVPAVERSVAPSQRAASSSSPGHAIRRLALPIAFAAVSVLALVAYLMAVHSVGLDNEESRTVGTTVLVMVGLWLVLDLEWDNPDHGKLISRIWIGFAAVYAIGIALPWVRDALHLGKPTVTVLVLSMAGAGLGIALAQLGMRTMRARAAQERAGEGSA